VLGSVGVAALLIFGLRGLGENTLVLARDDVVIGRAVQETFAPSVRVEAAVGAADATIVTAREGGVLVRIVRRNGDLVQQGDVMLRLDNPALVRDVADRQSRLIAQLSEIVGAEGQIAAQQQQARNAVRDGRFRLTEVERNLARQSVLAERGFASGMVIEGLRADRDYARQVAEDSVAALRVVDRDSAERMQRLRASRTSLERLMEAETRRLDALDVRADARGRITGLDLAIGAPVPANQAIARIEDDQRIELVAQMPESRQADIRLGGSAQADIGGASRSLRIREIDPKVTNGQVQVRLEFTDAPPKDLRLGQSIPVQVAVGAARRAVTLQAGAAVGPDRVFVLEGSSARARPARLGERSGQRVEVLSGVRPGDNVIITAAGKTDDADLIRLQPQ